MTNRGALGTLSRGRCPCGEHPPSLALALIGMYGLLTHWVTQRRHEIGVRMALGAQRREVVHMVVRRGMAIALAGIGTGVVGALALTRVMSTLLYDVAPRDPLTFTVVTAGWPRRVCWRASCLH